jgi:hypothetical protein
MSGVKAITNRMNIDEAALNRDLLLLPVARLSQRTI